MTACVLAFPETAPNRNPNMSRPPSSSDQNRKPAPKPPAQGDALHFLIKDANQDGGSHKGYRRHSLFHSRFVRAMKLLLPAGAVLLLGAMLLWPQLQAESKRFNIGLSGLDPRHPDRLKVVNARYQGIDGQGQPYEVLAESAFETKEGSREIALDAPSADLLENSGAWVLSNAPEGVYNRDTQQLRLTGGVTLFHDKGYTFSSPTAVLDMKNGYAYGTDPAMAYGPGGEIKGEAGFEILDKGRRILFKGKSRLILRPGGSFDVSNP